jgi:hypothetical protein
MSRWEDITKIDSTVPNYQCLKVMAVLSWVRRGCTGEFSFAAMNPGVL